MRIVYAMGIAVFGSTHNYLNPANQISPVVNSPNNLLVDEV
jgi:hypothetical protein